MITKPWLLDMIQDGFLQCINMLDRWKMPNLLLKFPLAVIFLLPRGHRELAELPSVSTLIAEDESGHRLISTSRLNLRVGGVLLLAFATAEQV